MKRIKVRVTEPTTGNHFDETFATAELARQYAAFVNESATLKAEVLGE